MVKEKKPSQPTLKGYKPTALENASRDYLLAKQAVEDAKDALDRQGISMIEALKHEGRTSLITEGFTISVDITPAREKLKCKKLEQK